MPLSDIEKTTWFNNLNTPFAISTTDLTQNLIRFTYILIPPKTLCATIRTLVESNPTTLPVSLTDAWAQSLTIVVFPEITHLEIFVAAVK